MIRTVFALVLAFTMAGYAPGDPIKKVPSAEVDKLVKVCVDAFVKNLFDDTRDTAIKYCDVPFRWSDGTKRESLDELKKEFDRPRQKGHSLVVGEVYTLDKINSAFKNAGHDELSSDLIKEYGDLAGTEARVVLIVPLHNGIHSAPKGVRPHLLVRVKDGKARIVGMGE